MARKSAAKDQDKFVVRLPDGMRDRIKAKADRAGMSMNEAIVWCLEQYFPAPQTFDQKINELIEMLALLKGDDTSSAVDMLIGEIDTALNQIAKKQLVTPSGFRDAVNERFQRYLEEEQENLRELHDNPFDDENYPESVGGIPYDEIDWDAPHDPNDPFAIQRKKPKT